MSVTTTTNPADTGDDFDENDDTQKGGDGGKSDDGGKSGDNGDGKGRIEVKDGKTFVDGEEFDVERALGTIETQRASEKKLKNDLKEVKAQLKELGKKDTPADEQVKQERDELRDEVGKLESKLQKQALRSAALTVATELKFRNPAIAYKLIDPDDIDWDDDGEPTNVNTLLKREAKANTYLVRRGRTRDDDEEEVDDGADGGKGRGSGTAGGPNDMNAMIRRAAG